MRENMIIDYNIAPELNYIVLELLDYINHGTNIKIVHLIQLIDETISIGRLFANDILDTNSTVSQNLDVIKYNKDNGNLTIEDRNSTLGTLVLIKGNIRMKEKKISFQVGKSLVTAGLVEKKETGIVYFANDINDILNNKIMSLNPLLDLKRQN